MDNMLICRPRFQKFYRLNVRQDDKVHGKKPRRRQELREQRLTGQGMTYFFLHVSSYFRLFRDVFRSLGGGNLISYHSL